MCAPRLVVFLQRNSLGGLICSFIEKVPLITKQGYTKESTEWLKLPQIVSFFKDSLHQFSRNFFIIETLGCEFSNETF